MDVNANGSASVDVDVDGYANASVGVNVVVVLVVKEKFMRTLMSSLVPLFVSGGCCRYCWMMNDSLTQRWCV